MPSPIRFGEIRKRLEAAGYRLVRIRSSHHIFDRPGGPLGSIPVHRGKVKPRYGAIVNKIVEEDQAAKGERAGQQEEQPGEGEKS